MMRKNKAREKSRDDFLDRQLRKQAHTEALKECKDKGITRNPYNDPYDPYWSYLSTFEVLRYNKLRIEHGLASPNTPKPQSIIDKLFKPAKVTYREDWQDKVYG